MCSKIITYCILLTTLLLGGSLYAQEEYIVNHSKFMQKSNPSYFGFNSLNKVGVLYNTIKLNEYDKLDNKYFFGSLTFQDQGFSLGVDINSFKIHKWLNFETIFRIHYSKNIVQDVKFLVLKPKGKIIRRFLKMFNSLFGIIILTSILKIMKGVFPQILGHEIEDLDDVNIRTSIRNFEKI